MVLTQHSFPLFASNQWCLACSESKDSEGENELEEGHVELERCVLRARLGRLSQSFTHPHSSPLKMGTGVLALH